MQRIAVPMIGGMISSTILTLIVIPAVYALIKGWGLPKAIDQATVAKMLARSRNESLKAGLHQEGRPRPAE